MLDTLHSKEGGGSIAPIQLDVSPPGVNDLNRPMLLNTTASRWKELGLASCITKPKYQRRQSPRRQEQEHLLQQKCAQNNAELMAMSKLMKHTTTVNGGAQTTTVERLGLRPSETTSVGADRSGAQVKRSRSEPTHLPPIDEGGPITPAHRNFCTPGSRTYATGNGSPLLYDLPGRRDHAGSRSGVYRRVDNRGRPVGTAGARGRKATVAAPPSPTAKIVTLPRPDSTVTHVLPTLPRVTEQKIRYMDGSFIKGVQRHTGRHNMNLALGKSPRMPRYSWEDGRTYQRRSPEAYATAAAATTAAAAAAADNANTQQVPLTLRDMDFALPVKNKMEHVRQWHEDQFWQYMEQWKPAAGTGGDMAAGGSKADARELLAKYKESSRNWAGTPPPPPRSLHLPAHAVEEGGASGEQDDSAYMAEPSPKPRARMTRSSARAARNHDTGKTAENIKHVDPICLEDKQGMLLTKDATSKGQQNAVTRLLNIDWKDVKGARRAKEKQQQQDEKQEQIYTDPQKYIEENHLLPPEKSRRIQDWLDGVDLSSCMSLSSASLSSGSGCMASTLTITTSSLPSDYEQL